MGELIAALDERLQHRVVVKFARHREPARLAGPRMKLGERLIEPAVLAQQDLLHLRSAQSGEQRLDVAAKPAGNLNGGFLAAKTLRFEQSCHQLVPIVEWRPGPV